MMNLGRNDPCHCGSGKKYKKCHLDADQRERARLRPSEAESASPAAIPDLKALPHLLDQLSRSTKAGDRKQIADLVATSKPLIEYMAHREEIEAAGAELEAHRAAFEKFARDEERYTDLSRAVFSEQCFAPLRFTATDIQRAFDQVGYPALMAADEQTVETLRAAILHLADKERRDRLSMELLLRLPEFVRAGRYLEGWLVQGAAFDTTEHPDESNAFLFQMFSFGYDAWAAGKRAQDESLFREMGFDLDRLRGMNLNELDAWIKTQAADPAQAGMLETFFRNNPHLREESVANLEAMERNSTKLLEREDSGLLLIPDEEVQPWLTLFNERFNQSGLASPPPGVALSEESVLRTFEEVALPLMREMAVGIFSHDRIGQLIASLKQYRNDRFAAGDKITAEQAMGAINYLEREDSPGENTFLLTLCWRSMDAAIKAAGIGDHGD